MAFSWNKILKKEEAAPGSENVDVSSQETSDEDADRMRKLTRAQLLELLVMESREKEQLEKELAEARNALEDRRLRVERAGSIAEAALSVNGIFERAQETADQYLENIRTLREETEAECARMRADTEAACAKMRTETESECAKRKADAAGVSSSEGKDSRDHEDGHDDSE